MIVGKDIWTPIRKSSKQAVVDTHAWVDNVNFLFFISPLSDTILNQGSGFLFFSEFGIRQIHNFKT